MEFKIKCILMIIVALLASGVSCYFLRQLVFRVFPRLLRSTWELFIAIIMAIIHLPFTLYCLLKNTLIFLIWELPGILFEKLINLTTGFLKIALYACAYLALLLFWISVLSGLFGIS